MRNVGVLLCGCGAYDGSDVHETVLLSLALRRRGLRVRFLAPEVLQADVVDHSRGDTDTEGASRHAFVESARLARGSVQALGEASPADFDALVIPGGMGVVRTLCVAGESALGGQAPRPEVAALLDALASRRAPIATVGLGRVVVERHRGIPSDDAALRVDVGSVVRFGDPEVLFTPGFLASDSIEEVAAGIDGLADELARLLGSVSALDARIGRS